MRVKTLNASLFCIHSLCLKLKGLTKCQLEKAKALQHGSSGLQPVGRFIPQCEQDGAYSQTQCWGSTGSCWCVDNEGVEVTGTRVRGKPSCPSGRSGLFNFSFHSYLCLLVVFFPCCLLRSRASLDLRIKSIILKSQ